MSFDHSHLLSELLQPQGGSRFLQLLPLRYPGGLLIAPLVTSLTPLYLVSNYLNSVLSVQITAGVLSSGWTLADRENVPGGDFLFFNFFWHCFGCVLGVELSTDLLACGR